MTLDDAVVCICLMLFVVFGVGYWYTSNTVYIRKKLGEWSVRMRFAPRGTKFKRRDVNECCR